MADVLPPIIFPLDEFKPFFYSLLLQPVQAQQIMNKLIAPPQQQQQLQLQQQQQQQLQQQQIVHNKPTPPLTQPSAPTKQSAVTLPSPPQQYTMSQPMSLFWCCYIASRGQPAFGKRTIQEEMEEQQAMVATFRKNPKCLKDKRHRITIAEMEEIITDILTMSNRSQDYNTAFGVLQVNLALAIAYGIYFKLNIYVACSNRRIYTSFCNDMAEKSCLLILDGACGGGRLFRLHWDGGESEIDKVKAEYLEMENYKKPLRAISHYSAVEIQELYERLGATVVVDEGVVAVGGKMKKQDYYKLIETHCFTRR